MALVNMWSGVLGDASAFIDTNLLGYSAVHDRGDGGGSLWISAAASSAVYYGALGGWTTSTFWNDRQQPLDVGTITVRDYIYFSGFPASNNEEIIVLRRLSLTTHKLSIRINSTGTLSVYDSAVALKGTTTTALSLNTWYRVEILCPSSTTATVELRIYADDDNAPILIETLTLTNTNTTTTNHGYVYFGKVTNRNSQGYTCYHNSIAIRTDSTSPGHARHKLLLPNADGTHTSWTGVYTACDEVPPDGDTTFVSTGTANAKETFQLQSLADKGLVGTEVINGVTVTCNVRTASGSQNVRSLARSGTTEVMSGYKSVSTLWWQLGLTMETDPNTLLPWTHAGAAALEAGAMYATSGSTVMRMTAAYGLVEYVPPVSGGPGSGAEHAEMFT